MSSPKRKCNDKNCIQYDVTPFGVTELEVKRKEDKKYNIEIDEKKIEWGKKGIDDKLSNQNVFKTSTFGKLNN